jgi:hypothetical protein
MELLVIIVIAVAAIGWFLWKDRKYEESGSHPLDGATKAPEQWPFPTSRPAEGDSAPAATSVLDVNKDGKVDIKDAVAAAEVVVEKTKKTATKAKAKVKETAAKAKATVKKTTAKKTKTK